MTLNPSVVFIIIIAIIIGNYLLGLLLDLLNASRWSAELPEELKGIYDVEEYRKSQEYSKDNQRLGILTASFSTALLLAVLFAGGFAWLDGMLRNITENPLLLALMFFGIIALVSDVAGIPFDLYDTFVIEERYGFNKTTPATFFLDKIKGWLLILILGGGLLALVVWIYGITGQWFWLVTWGVIIFVSLILSLFYSNLIVPLFNKQTPLEDGELREKIEDFATLNQFKLKDIYVINGSRRSSKANAYFTGFGPRKRIVLYDTLIDHHPVDELVAILAHEIGHYRKKHTLVGLLMSFLSSGIMLYLLSLLLEYPAFSQALGIEEHSFHAGLLSFGLLYGPLSMLLGLVQNALSRKFEYQADRYAAQRYDATALEEALKRLSVKHLSNLRPHPAYVVFHYSHPPLLKRLAALESEKKKVSTGLEAGQA